MDNSHDIIYGLAEVALFLTNQCGRTDYSQTIEDACSELSKHRWIPVSERIPKTGKAVLVCCDDKLQKSMVVAYIDALGLWHPISNDHIAYWMPLPQPPQEG